jgi:uncharacterized membrane protein YphA (DoxX/SURF4 family)
VARLVVGGVWIWAGLLKVPHPEASITAVRAYQLLPIPVADGVGRVLPMFEVVVGACLLLGLLTRLSGAVSALLLLAFIVGIVSVWSRGIAINCGCFGDGGHNPDAISTYPWEIARDVGLFLLSALVVWVRSTPLSVDTVIFPPRPEQVHVEERP